MCSSRSAFCVVASRVFFFIHSFFFVFFTPTFAPCRALQGYLKFSLSIVGPPDRMHVHKDNEDDTNGGSKDLSTMVREKVTAHDMKRNEIIVSRKQDENCIYLTYFLLISLDHFVCFIFFLSSIFVELWCPRLLHRSSCPPPSRPKPNGWSSRCTSPSICPSSIPQAPWEP